MLERRSARGPAILIGAVIIVLVGAAYLWMAGSAVVLDETGAVESAYVVTRDGREQRLGRMWSGHFDAIPRLEGFIRVRCRDGSTKDTGYAAPHMHSRIRIAGETPCARLEG